MTQRKRRTLDLRDHYLYNKLPIINVDLSHCNNDYRSVYDHYIQHVTDDLKKVYERSLLNTVCILGYNEKLIKSISINKDDLAHDILVFLYKYYKDVLAKVFKINVLNDSISDHNKLVIIKKIMCNIGDKYDSRNSQQNNPNPFVVANQNFKDDYDWNLTVYVRIYDVIRRNIHRAFKEFIDICMSNHYGPNYKSLYGGFESYELYYKTGNKYSNRIDPIFLDRSIKEMMQYHLPNTRHSSKNMIYTFIKKTCDNYNINVITPIMMLLDLYFFDGELSSIMVHSIASNIIYNDPTKCEMDKFFEHLFTSIFDQKDVIIAISFKEKKVAHLFHHSIPNQWIAIDDSKELNALQCIKTIDALTSGTSYFNSNELSQTIKQYYCAISDRKTNIIVRDICRQLAFVEFDRHIAMCIEELIYSNTAYPLVNDAQKINDIRLIIAKIAQQINQMSYLKVMTDILNRVKKLRFPTMDKGKHYIVSDIFTDATDIKLKYATINNAIDSRGYIHITWSDVILYNIVWDAMPKFKFNKVFSSKLVCDCVLAPDPNQCTITINRDESNTSVSAILLDLNDKNAPCMKQFMACLKEYFAYLYNHIYQTMLVFDVIYKHVCDKFDTGAKVVYDGSVEKLIAQLLYYYSDDIKDNITNITPYFKYNYIDNTITYKVSNGDDNVHEKVN
nr:MAG TPA: hypothetical protein [Caudoviricetes sp.]